ncbi:MoeA-like, domain I and II [Sphingobium herbicidovorans NBRC 16415]|uniref:Molybdopterin molybdenumtransferase n=1 Tax=Sphingobium herbicidovorans (strain ATCC 700291 / DSM 11019 / CCUG 56400 / KCTC 2939 / LMG 18315 / NBRC 16415 / MH) TaxID=1219045 RepID=A0A086P876_SPHHM|nr:molybdopterin molybdotransferase MoeA [Sphingobium herbicidovorans]KFG89594.1 MoeA-like, domain I and II [Sphingobium herbicidovorans NBRC 16415]
MSLLPVAEAQARLLALGDRLAAEDVPASACAGRWLARDIHALRDQPWADLSAMDGYAIRASEWPGPWRVTAESIAGGGLPLPLAAGESARIFTGAPLPPGADTVLIQEDADLEEGLLHARGPGLSVGRNVRPAASDFHKGQQLLTAGAALGPAQIALAVLGGHGSLPVGARPRVALISTGNELVPPGAPTPPGRLPSSNGPMLGAMLGALGCEILDIGIVPDDLDLMIQSLERASQADIIVSTGGASVGDHDLVRPAFAAAGGDLDFWKIRMRPGKPLMAGKLRDAIFLGLPGNPVSAFVTATLFLLPLVRHMAGAADPLPRIASATLAAPLPATGERDDYLRAFRTGDGLIAVTSQDSAATAALARADSLIVRTAGSAPAAVGDQVAVISLHA